MWSNACQIHSTKDEGVGPGIELSVQYTYQFISARLDIGVGYVQTMRCVGSL